VSWQQQPQLKVFFFSFLFLSSLLFLFSSCQAEANISKRWCNTIQRFEGTLTRHSIPLDWGLETAGSGILQHPTYFDYSLE